MLAFSTSEYNIAICKESLGGFHYIHQNRKNKTQIFLPVIKCRWWDAIAQVRNEHYLIQLYS
ncbi:MAG: hypothetical protein WBB28_22945 [Crinalium sp.]